VETSFLSQTDVAEWRAAVKPTTRLLFAETPTNPLTDVCDIQALADIAHNAGALLAVDNCFCSPALQRPVELGADLIIHSGTKYLDGQGRVMAGAICGPSEIRQRCVRPVVRTAGMVLSPFNAWVVTQGHGNAGHPHAGAMRQCALALAKWLQSHPRVAHVYYPGLALAPAACAGDAPARRTGRRGGVVRRAHGGPGAAAPTPSHVIDSTQVCSVIATNLGDTKTIITHPATTSHGRLTEDQRQAAGIGQGLIRVAVGLEHLDDIKADLVARSGHPDMTPKIRTRFRPVTHRIHPPRQHPLGLVPLGLCPCQWRRLHPAHRRHGPGALQPGRGGRHSSKAWPGSAWTMTKAPIYQMQRMDRYKAVLAGSGLPGRSIPAT
jgi:O-succinylhomoserine sulfhydrylase